MNQSINYFGQHLFAQVVSLCRRHHLAEIITASKVDRYYKKLKCYEHFISMLYCAMSGSTSLRETAFGLKLAQGKLNHLNIGYVPPRSTLSDGNRERSSEVFRKIYDHLYQLYKPSLSDSRIPKEIIEKLFLLDATIFSLFKAILKPSGVLGSENNSKKKGGLKKNTLLEGTSLMPTYIKFGAASENDRDIYKLLSLPSGSYIVFDKGYNKHSQYATFTKQGIFFITRLREDADFSIERECVLGDTQNVPLQKEQLILLRYLEEDGIPRSLRVRRIVWRDEATNKVYQFITNNLQLESSIIANLYRFRWKIELFFKKLKQNFPLQYFVGDNQNAIEIQIWCCLIGLLLLSAVHNQHNSSMAFTVFVSLMQKHLFSYISIKDLLLEFATSTSEKRYAPDLFNSS